MEGSDPEQSGMFKGGNEMSSEKRFLYRQRFGYGMGDFACNLIWQVISLYLLYFYTDVMKLNAAAIATMFVVCRVIDGITDILVVLRSTRRKPDGERAVPGSCSAQFHSRCPLSWPSVSRIFPPAANLSTHMPLTYSFPLCTRSSISRWHRSFPH